MHVKFLEVELADLHEHDEDFGGEYDSSSLV